MNRLDRVPGRPTCQESPNPNAPQQPQPMYQERHNDETGSNRRCSVVSQQ
jgi:hypothetical protein